MIYALLIVLLLAGCHGVEKVQTTKMYPSDAVFVYVYDRDAGVWNRATKETLMKADCDRLHYFAFPTDGDTK